MSANEVVTIDNLAFGGDGVGRLAGGKVVFVPCTAPGDVAGISLTEEKSSYAHGAIREILKPSPQRIKPGCPVFGRCGGCAWQHLEIHVQRRHKRELLLAELRRVLPDFEEEEMPSLAGPEAFGFRDRTRLHLRGGVFGTMRRKSNEIVPFYVCPILVPELESYANELQQFLQQTPEIGDADFELYIDAHGRRGLHVEPTERAAELPIEKIVESLRIASFRKSGFSRKQREEQHELLTENSAGRDFSFEPGVFVQTSRAANEILVNTALDAAGQGGSFIEVYAGAGNFSVHLVEKFDTGVVAEGSKRAAELLEQNIAASQAQVEIRNEADYQTARYLSERPPADLLFADPPRSGMKPLYSIFEKAAPARVVMVSCHPMAAIRDIDFLVNQRGYKLERIAPVDMFPQTAHLEMMAALSRG